MNHSTVLANRPQHQRANGAVRTTRFRAAGIFALTACLVGGCASPAESEAPALSQALSAAPFDGTIDVTGASAIVTDAAGNVIPSDAISPVLTPTGSTSFDATVGSETFSFSDARLDPATSTFTVTVRGRTFRMLVKGLDGQQPLAPSANGGLKTQFFPLIVICAASIKCGLIVAAGVVLVVGTISAAVVAAVKTCQEFQDSCGKINADLKKDCRAKGGIATGGSCVCQPTTQSTQPDCLLPVGRLENDMVNK